MFASDQRTRNEQVLQRLEAEVSAARGPTGHWAYVNEPKELGAAMARRGPIVISAYYSLSPSARKACMAVDRLSGL